MSEVTYIQLPEGFTRRVKISLAAKAEAAGVHIAVSSVAGITSDADADALAMSLAKIVTEAVVGELIKAGVMTLSDPG